MDEKSKLFVFDKKEVILLFLFILLSTVLSFTLGVKIGSDYSFEKSGYTSDDRSTADNFELKSEAEESTEAVISKHEKAEDKEKVLEKTEKALEEEFNRLDVQLSNDDQPVEVKRDEAPKIDNSMAKVAENTVQDKPMNVATDNSLNDVDPSNYIGKYTIQLGSYPNVDEAQKFADGFKIRGYQPIINEVNLGQKGIWYRVSLGVFENIAEARDYVQKESSLFDRLDYVFGKLE